MKRARELQLAEDFRSMRKKLKMTQSQLARKFWIPVYEVRKFEEAEFGDYPNPLLSGLVASYKREMRAREKERE